MSSDGIDKVVESSDTEPASAHREGPHREAPAKAISERKLRANRQNALKSTGPKTEAGKAASRWNSLKHGLASKVLLESDHVSVTDKEGLADLLSALREHYNPVGPVEELLVQRIVVQEWRIQRGLNAETKLFATAELPFACNLLSNMDRYNTSAERGLHRALAELQHLQEVRQEKAARSGAAEDENQTGASAASDANPEAETS